MKFKMLPYQEKIYREMMEATSIHPRFMVQHYNRHSGMHEYIKMVNAQRDMIANITNAFFKLVEVKGGRR